MSHIPSSAGTFRVVTEKRQIRGRNVRVRSLVFTSHDGFVGESVPNRVNGGRFNHQEAYHAAIAQRASALYDAQMKATNQLPQSAWLKVNKPAPVAVVQLVPNPTKLSDSALFEEVERRGFEVHTP